MDKSEKRAKEIINHHIKKIETANLSCLLSIVLVGSLSNGSYTGKAGSDIDLIHIIDDGAPLSAKDMIIRLIEETENETNNDIPISRTVYNLIKLKTSYSDFQDNDLIEFLELPVEILRMKESGITLFGEKIIDSVRTPTKEDMLKSFEVSKQKTERLKYTDPAFCANYQKTIMNPPMRPLVQIVLTTAMKDLYMASGISCSSKLTIANRMKECVPDYMFTDLLDLCVKWRYEIDLFTEEDEIIAKALYQAWRIAREGRAEDFVPLKT